MFKMMWACGFVLVLLLPQFPSIREIDFSETDLFPSASIDSCGEEDTVNLSRLNLSTIPTHVIRSGKIRHVDLSLNKIENVPNSFFRDVPNVECLDLTGNVYSPRMIFGGSNSDSLKTLILGRVKFDRRGNNPCTMTGYFPNLETLHLNDVSPCTIDESFQTNLPRLVTLFLMDYGYDSQRVWRLPSTLRHLHLEGTRYNSYTVNTINNLESLYLGSYSYFNALSIPSQTANLQVLSCRNCSLTVNSINQVFYYSRRSLRLLDFSHNSLSSLPSNMYTQANNLERLLLSNNSFTKMPDVQRLPRLRELVLNDNRIDQVADPRSNSLKILGLRGNNISRISNTTFQGLPALEVLDLSGNKLASLPVGWARSLKNLLSLNLKSNLFAKLSDTSLTTATSDLRHLFMKGNLFNKLVEQDLKLVPDNCTIHMM
ncbi:extracellular matrix protein 2-like [Halictus rubicundus]|uniref:extracellular matrix protein 2-like n=1 Tax=Halictus rubicundus TaxID=77578 RepID=UPI00403526A7